MDTKNSKSVDTEIDLTRLIKQIWEHKSQIIKLSALFLIVGLIAAISIPREYTCIIKMAPEGSKSSITGSMSGLAAMAGINIGSTNTEGVNLTIYPDVVYSVPFITELINMKVTNKGLDNENSLYSYVDNKIKEPWWKVAAASPFKIIDLIRSGKENDLDKEINPYHLTKKQAKVIIALQNRISISIDEETGIITTGVTLQNPELAAVVADSLVIKLERFVINYRTNKAKRDLDFAMKVFSEAKQSYYETQKNYARYIDENKNVVLESVKIEQERLKNEQSLAYSVYSSLAQQVEKARMKVQEQTPCVTVIEPARVPVEKSNTSRMAILLGFGFLGAIFGLIKVIYSSWNSILIRTSEVKTTS
jgi:uncharacterized protein involved in exopolysaccharide biosynthesis